jgi:hypothetical protein
MPDFEEEFQRCCLRRRRVFNVPVQYVNKYPVTELEIKSLGGEGGNAR